MLKEGDKAPAFEMATDEGTKVSLRDFAGKTLVLYFYPRDNTPGCTRQAQGFTAARRAIEGAGGAVIGVSRDSLKSHQSFREKCKLGITLASDPDLSVHKAYGAWGTKTMYGKKIEGVLRTTFLVRDGKIARVFPNVKVDGHADAVLDAIGALGGGGRASAASKKAEPKKTAAAPKKTAAAPKKTAAAPKKKTAAAPKRAAKR